MPTLYHKNPKKGSFLCYNMKKVNKMKILKNIGIIISTICILLILLYFSTYIPGNRIKKNVSTSANILYKQGKLFHKNSLGRRIIFHNHTDALMINISYGIDPNNKLESILINRRNYNPKVKVPIVKEYAGNLETTGKDFDTTRELLQFINNKRIPSYEYMKYWHGYIIVIKPLLLFFNITGIRIILTLLILTSLSFLCYLVYKEIDWKTSLAIFLSFISVDIIVTALFNVQGILVFLISIISSIIVFKKDLSDTNFYLLLIINGILTAFFDFLTTPIIALLVPVIIRNLKDQKKRSNKETILYFGKCCIMFFVSYALFWFSKWLLVDLIYHRNLIKTGILETLFRTGVTHNDYSITQSLFLNFAIVFNPLILIIIFLYIKNYKKILNKENLIYGLSIITVILWFTATSQHASQHFFFTYRNYVVISLAMLLTAFSKSKSKRKRKNND